LVATVTFLQRAANRRPQHQTAHYISNGSAQAIALLSAGAGRGVRREHRIMRAKTMYLRDFAGVQ
jgi:hypothetical protein